MITQDSASQKLNLMAKNEEIIGRIYRRYGELFPEHKEFWDDLAREESIHCLQLTQLGEKVNRGEAIVNKDRFTLEAITAFLDFLKQELARAVTGGLSLRDALAVGFQLENGLLERKFFEIVSSDSPEMKHLLGLLGEDTERHLAKIDSLWNLERLKLEKAA